MNERDQKILDFLEGRLSREDEHVFEAEMQSDPSLREEVSDYQKILGAFKANRLKQKKKQLKAWRAKGNPIPEIRTRGRWLRRLLISAALGGIILIGYWLFNNNGTERLYAEYYKMPSFIIRAGGNAGSVVDYCRSRMNRTDVNFEEIIDTLNQLSLEDTTAFANAQYLLGHAYMNRQNREGKENFGNALFVFEQAKQYLDFINLRVQKENEPGSRFVSQYDIAWFQALTHLKLDEPEVAEGLLSDLENTPVDSSFENITSDYPERASILLEELQKR